MKLRIQYDQYTEQDCIDAYWDGVHNAQLIAEKELNQTKTHLKNAQSLLSKYAQENIELQNHVGRLQEILEQRYREIDDLYRNRLFIFLYGQLSVIAAYLLGVWL